MRVQCPTCLEEFTPEDDLQCPPCGHVFHRHCVQEWFDYKRAGGDRPDCPQCRKVTNVNKLMKIYLAEAECDSHDDREKDLYRQIEEIKYKLEFKEGENNSLIDKVEDLESRLNEKAEELNKSQIETNRNKKDKKVLNQKLQKLESEREEIENLLEKWTKSKRMLLELEEKQGQLKMKLRETEIQKNEHEKRHKEADKGRKKAEDDLRECWEMLRKLHIQNNTLEVELVKLADVNKFLKKELKFIKKELISLEEEQEPTLRMKSREAEIHRKEKEFKGKENKYIFIVTVAQCLMAFLLYLCGSEEWFHSLVSHIMGILGLLLYDVYYARFAPGKK